MPLLKRIPDMTPEELDRRARWHKSTAEMFAHRQEFSTAQKFQQLSDLYAEELGRREQ
jgi:hypothetical protein